MNYQVKSALSLLTFIRSGKKHKCARPGSICKVNMTPILYLRDYDSRRKNKRKEPGTFQNLSARMKFSVQIFVGQFVKINQRADGLAKRPYRAKVV